MTTPRPKYRWYHLTPARLFAGLLAVQVFLLLSERFKWFAFNEKKGWTVLIALGVVCVAVVVMLVWAFACLLLRRRFQFGVRSLLLFLLAVSVPLGWFAWEMQKARRQREVVKRIRDVSAPVEYDFEHYDFYKMETPKEPAEPAWLRSLLGEDFFSEVVVFGSPRSFIAPGPIDNDFMKHVDDDFAKHVGELTGLRVVLLDEAPITDNGLAHLKRLTNIRTLWLDRTQISDNGLAHLARMTELQRLQLDRTQITDAGLQHLTGLTELKWLDLRFTHVTDEGIKKLQQALPNCEIIR
jgi:hypothetical protein